MRELYTARLERKLLLSAAAQCYHFEFVFTTADAPALEAGQFLSLVADDPAGKTYTRAYSIASAPRPHRFDLCVNRVEGGFFSNLLCDLEEGASIQCHGPHGLFTLKQPIADGLMIAAGTGIAPMRGFVQWLFPESGEGRSAGREFSLVYGAAEAGELFYDSYFRSVAARHAGFRYLPVVTRYGLEEQMAAAIASAAQEQARTPEAAPVQGADSPPGALEAAFARYAYVCGLNETVKAARAQLTALGWAKRQVLFERYD